MPAMPYLLAALAVGYLFGSIPFGVVLTRLAGLGDVRKIGSGNIGATNVLRTGHKALAAATLFGDAAKGAVAVALAWHWGLETAIFAAFGAFIGHLYPIWLRFKGGKGVATFLGCLIALQPLAGLAFVGIWLLAAFLTRYSSVAALAASAATPLVLLLLGEPQIAALMLLLAIILWWKHRENINRLLKGAESKIGQTG